MEGANRPAAMVSKCAVDCYHYSSGCGPRSPFYFNGGGIKPDDLLRRLMELPQHIRDQIYELVVRHPYNAPTWWLGADGNLRAPCPDAYTLPKPDHLSIPTLENKDGPWLKWSSSSFCIVQTFVEQLHMLSAEGSQSASDCVEDFGEFFGERTIIEMNRFRDWICKSRLRRTVRKDPCLQLRNLEPLFKHIKHLCLEVKVPNQSVNKPDSVSYKIVTGAEDFTLRCEKIHNNIPTLKSLVVFCQLTTQNLKKALILPEQQSWIQGCKLIAAEKVNVRLYILDRSTEDDEPMSRILSPGYTDRSGEIENLWKDEERSLENILSPTRNMPRTGDLWMI
ncbi:uncharacterized protein LY89DRAFT_735997 [Mollisia scopiformis]|uniref:Uncharacterized protein n=1 Tax=Mollisia scopiformis TaxID=149040 RepID=A0A194X428_MOLSC|nr:uncharacterized protein LY89DRAFT_735997 [Mollisia scopiformis]KUJ14940.1 hypothetical protein LY89DRAFT_735997 [Mollisia scopiformis]